MDPCGLEGLPQDHRLQGHGTWRYHSPAVTLSEAMETTRIPGVVERTGDRTAVVTTRPYRDPHHTISDVGLIGGGQVPMPGEVSLAHHGMLFLDELPECPPPRAGGPATAARGWPHRHTSSHPCRT